MILYLAILLLLLFANKSMLTSLQIIGNAHQRRSPFTAWPLKVIHGHAVSTRVTPTPAPAAPPPTGHL